MYPHSLAFPQHFGHELSSEVALTGPSSTPGALLQQGPLRQGRGGGQEGPAPLTEADGFPPSLLIRINRGVLILSPELLVKSQRFGIAEAE